MVTPIPARAVAVLGAVVLVAIGAAPAHASTWLGAARLSPELTSPTPPALAGNGGGLLIAGWATREGAADTDVDGAVRVAERRPGGGWGAPITVFTPVTPGFNGDVRIAVADSGAAVATWQLDGGTIGFATRSASGDWRAGATLTGGTDASPVALPDGTAVVTFISPDRQALRAVRIGADGTAATPFDVFTVPTPTATIDSATAGLAEGSGALLAGAAWSDAGGAHVVVRQIYPDDSASPFVCGGTTGDYDVTLAAGAAPQVLGDVQLVADGAGGIVTALAVRTNAPATQVTVANCQAAVPGWSQRVLTGVASDPGPTLGARGGRVVAAWIAGDGVATMTRNLRSGQSSWSTPGLAIPFAAIDAAPGTAASVSVGSDADGRFVLPLLALKPGALVFTSAHGTGDAPWALDSTDVQPAAPLTSAYRPAVAAVQPGAFVAIWRNQLGAKYARTADLDVLPPALAIAGVPARVVAGTPIGATVSGQDGFSGFDAAGTTWDLRDGGSRTGPSAGVTYLTPGTRTITVTGRDRAGNTATATATTEVVAPSVPLRDVTSSATWRRSRLTGALQVRLAQPGDATLAVTVRAARTGAVVLRGAIRPGQALVTLPWPAGLAPGGYQVTIDGTRGGAAVVPLVRSVRVPPPPEGVGRATLNVVPGARAPIAVQVFGRQRRLWAYLHLSARPRGPVSALWYPPRSARPLTPVVKRPRALMEFVLRSSGLAPGTWRIVFTARGRVITTAQIRLRG